MLPTGGVLVCVAVVAGTGVAVVVGASVAAVATAVVVGSGVGANRTMFAVPSVTGALLILSAVGVLGGGRSGGGGDVSSIFPFAVTFSRYWSTPPHLSIIPPL
jgi:hypothetical protein